VRQHHVATGADQAQPFQGAGDIRISIVHDQALATTEGAVSYATVPSFPAAADEALICCAVPASRKGGALHLAL
jgi:hypothetical protein